jgi:hypothetical protein
LQRIAAPTGGRPEEGFKVAPGGFSRVSPGVHYGIEKHPYR